MRHLRPAGRLAFFLLSHCQFPKRQVSLTWSASRENRLHSCLAHTCMCTHTHTSKKSERENEAFNERWQTSFFSLLWCTLGFCWTALALRCSCHVFCMRKWTKQKLIEESLGSLSCWKGMPSLMVQHFNLNHSLEEGGSCIRVTGIHSLLAPIKSIR